MKFRPDVHRMMTEAPNAREGEISDDPTAADIARMVAETRALEAGIVEATRDYLLTLQRYEEHRRAVEAAVSRDSRYRAARGRDPYVVPEADQRRTTAKALQTFATWVNRPAKDEERRRREQDQHARIAEAKREQDQHRTWLEHAPTWLRPDDYLQQIGAAPTNAVPMIEGRRR